MKYVAILHAVYPDGGYAEIIAAELVESQEAGELFYHDNKPDDGTQVDYTFHSLQGVILNAAAAPKLLAACKLVSANLEPAYSREHLCMKMLTQAITAAESEVLCDSDSN